MREFHAWIETTSNLVHVSVLLLVPLLIAGVTALANSVDLLPFVLFPPLASGTYTLFADPEGRYASPIAFVGGLTAGAVCGSAAVWVSGATASGNAIAGGTLASISPVAAALAVFLTGAVTWAFGVEEPAAFSTALLALVAPAFTQSESVSAFAYEYVSSVFAASVVVAFAFHLWRERFYERRARYLYRSMQGDDHVLVPMRGDHPERTAMLGARLAAAHDAGKVVLLDVVDDAAVAAAQRRLVQGAEQVVGSAAATDAGTAVEGSDLTERAEGAAASDAAERLEAQADRIETRIGIPCQVAVTEGDDSTAKTVLRTAHEANCDLIVTPYEERHGGLSPFVRSLFRGDVDVLAHRSAGERTRWKRVLVPVRRASDVAHAMLDFASRLAGSTGRVSACTCIGSNGDRRVAESMLANLVETFQANLETRVSRAAIEDFLENNAGQYDLIIIGASMDRSAASRFVSPPTFERIQDLDADVAILDRNF